MAKNTVIVSILGDTRDLQKKLGGASGSMGKFAKTAAVAAAAIAGSVVAIGARSVKAASELEQAMGGMESVFKANAAQMEKFATRAAGSLGLAKSEYANLATVLGSQLKNMGVSTDQLAGQTNQLIGLGADLAAQFGGSSSDAVAALSSLLRGERDPIERYGVSINEAAVKAKMAEMGLAGLTGEAEKNAKLQATLALLYQQTADAQGAFARESTTLAGAQQRLTAGTENLFATLGTSLLPAVTAVTAAIGAMVNKLQESEWFQTLTGNLTEASNKFADFVFGILNGTQSIDFSKLFDGLLTGIVTGIQKAAAWISGGGLVPVFAALGNAREGILSAALTLFEAIGQALPEILPAVIDALLTFVQQAVGFIVESVPLILDAAVQLFTGIVAAIPVIVPQIVGAIVTLITTLIPTLLALIPVLLDAAIQLFTAIIDALPVIIPQLIAAVISLIPVLIVTVIGLIPQLLDAAIQLFMALVEAIPLIIPNLLIAIVQMVPQIVTSIVKMVPTLLTAAVKLFTTLITAIPTIATKLGPELAKLGPRMVSAVQDMIPTMLNAGRDLIAGLARGLANNGQQVVNKLLNVAKGAINAFKNFFGIHSPSRLMDEMGVFLTKGLAGGIERDTRRVVSSVSDLNKAVRDEFDPDLTASVLATGRSASNAGDTAAAASSRRVYEITVQAIAPAYDVGKAVVEAIREFERVNGGLPAQGALA